MGGKKCSRCGKNPIIIIKRLIVGARIARPRNQPNCRIYAIDNERFCYMKIKKMPVYLMCLLIFTACVIPVAAESDVSPDLYSIIKSEAAVLINADTGQILFEKNMHQKLYPASITKVVTALLALENGNLHDTITMSRDAVFSIGRDTSNIALDYTEKLTLEQAMYALAIASANDAANGIAEHIGGNMENFANQMTERAKAAGALNTNFTNAHGLPDDNHYTTAYDMACIMMQAAKLPEFIEIFGTLYYEMPPTNKQKEVRRFRITNSLMVGDYEYEGVIAEKTGWTPAAQHTYVAIAKRKDLTLIAVVMKSPDVVTRWEDTTELFNYGFSGLLFSEPSTSDRQNIYGDIIYDITDTIAIPTASTVLINGIDIAFDAYNINGNNYFKLRDLAYILNGTAKQFEIVYDEKINVISLISGYSYTAVGGEMASKGNSDNIPVPTITKIYLDGKEVIFTAYNIDGNNYFKLRDIGQAFNFGIEWDGLNSIIMINTNDVYTGEL